MCSLMTDSNKSWFKEYAISNEGCGTSEMSFSVKNSIQKYHFWYILYCTVYVEQVGLVVGFGVDVFACGLYSCIS